MEKEGDLDKRLSDSGPPSANLVSTKSSLHLGLRTLTESFSTNLLTCLKHLKNHFFTANESSMTARLLSF